VSNLTLAIDEELLRRARIRAIEEGTSVNAVVREFLTAYAGRDGQVEAITRFLEIADQSQTGSDGTGRSWTREEIHDDRHDR
jgi:plasmid stability protein